MQLPVVEVSQFETTYNCRWQIYTPYVHYFVYHKKGSVLVKGMQDKVEKYVNEHYPASVINVVKYNRKWNYLLVKKNGKYVNNEKSYQSHWTTPKSMRLMFRPIKVGSRTKYEIMGRVKGEWKTLVTVRNIPKKWLPVYDQVDMENR